MPTWPDARSSRSPPVNALECGTIRSVVETMFKRGEGNLSGRSEEHTSELQSLMRTSYAVFCLKKKTERQEYIDTTTSTSVHNHRLSNTHQQTHIRRNVTIDTR